MRRSGTDTLVGQSVRRENPFDDLDLQESLLRDIYSYGFEKPCQAHSGTSKIATFVIGAIQRIDYSNHNCKALILAPTCKSAQQIHKVPVHRGPDAERCPNLREECFGAYEKCPGDQS